MANFKMVLPLELVRKLSEDLEEIRARQQIVPDAASHLPSYPDFVAHLMKSLDTPQEELHHAVTGLAGEAGEIAEVLLVAATMQMHALRILDLSKKVWIYGKEVNVEALIKELGDSRFYYQAILNFLSITDEQVIAQNILKLRARYSEGTYSDAQAIAQADKKNPVIGRDRSAPPTERKFMGKERISRTQSAGSGPQDSMVNAVPAGIKDEPLHPSENPLKV